jgi:hypothetical protein
MQTQAQSRGTGLEARALSLAPAHRAGHALAAEVQALKGEVERLTGIIEAKNRHILMPEGPVRTQSEVLSTGSVRSVG